MLDRLRRERIGEFPIDNPQERAIIRTHKDIGNTEIRVRQVEDSRFDDVAWESQTQVKVDEILLLLFAIAVNWFRAQAESMLSDVIPGGVRSKVPAILRWLETSTPNVFDVCDSEANFLICSFARQALAAAILTPEKVDKSNRRKGMLLENFPEICHSFYRSVDATPVEAVVYCFVESNAGEFVHYDVGSGGRISRVDRIAMKAVVSAVIVSRKISVAISDSNLSGAISSTSLGVLTIHSIPSSNRTMTVTLNPPEHLSPREQVRAESPRST